MKHPASQGQQGDIDQRDKQSISNMQNSPPNISNTCMEERRSLRGHISSHEKDKGEDTETPICVDQHSNHEKEKQTKEDTPPMQASTLTHSDIALTPRRSPRGDKTITVSSRSRVTRSQIENVEEESQLEPYHDNVADQSNHEKNSKSRKDQEDNTKMLKNSKRQKSVRRSRTILL